MAKAPKRVRITDEGEIARIISEVEIDHQPRIITRNDADIAVVMAPQDYQAMNGSVTGDIWASYDAAAALISLRGAQGILRGVDTARLKRDIRDARGQDSIGRPD